MPSTEVYGEGLKSASEIEWDDENQAASNIEYRKRRENKLKQVFGDKAPSKELPLQINSYNVLTRVLHTLVDIKEILQADSPKGIIWNYSFTLAGSDTLAHIDFEEGAEESDIPSPLQPFNFPDQKVFEVKIVNDGPGDLSFTTNLPRSVKYAQMNLKSGESDTIGPFKEPLIKSLKIVNTTPAQSVAIRFRILV